MTTNPITASDPEYPFALDVFPVRDDGLPATVRPNGARCSAKRWFRDWHDAPRNGHVHRGQDLFAPRGSAVLAPVPMRITKVAVDDGDALGGGNQLWARDAHGIEWFFSHMDAAPPVVVGQHVQAGEVIGAVGNTGNAARLCTHLHIRAAKGGVHYRLFRVLAEAPGAPPTRARTRAKERS